MAKTTVCRTCNRNVVMAHVQGNLVATETEVIEAIPAVRSGPEGGGFRSGDQQISVRRVHAGLCAGYVESARRERIAGEQRAFNRKNRNHGL